MDALCICWRGMAGSGKRTQVHEHLRRVAELRGLPFSIKLKTLEPRGDGISENAGDEGQATDAAGFTYEYSLVHMGYDIARMSMQDKHILRPILTKLGHGSQVMAGAQGRGCRIIVLYNAHLLSTESLLLIQACLEYNNGDLSFWLTSEMPVSHRIRDWFVEIPVAQKKTGDVWGSIFTTLIDRWMKAGQPTLADVKEVKSFVYEMLMRNLRWVEATHIMLDTVLEHPRLTEEQRRAAIRALAACEATAGGCTIPSYRIPIIWESLFLELRAIFSSVDKVANARAPARPRRAVSTRSKRDGTTGSGVATVQAT
jgi:hypothetical protein